MTQPSSSIIPAVKARLVELIGDALPDTPVGYARPPQAADQGEQVWLGKTTFTWKVPTIQAGRKPRDEVASIEINVSSWNSGLDPVDAETRTMVMVAAIEDIVANQTQLPRMVNGTPTAPIDGILESSLDSGTSECLPIATGAGGYEGFTTLIYSYHARLQ